MIKNKLRRWLGIDQLEGRMIDDNEALREDFDEFVKGKIRDVYVGIADLERRKLDVLFLEHGIQAPSLQKFVAAVDELVRLSGRKLVAEYVDDEEVERIVKRKKIWRLVKKVGRIEELKKDEN